MAVLEHGVLRRRTRRFFPGSERRYQLHAKDAALVWMTVVMSEQNCLFAAVRAVVGLSHCR